MIKAIITDVDGVLVGDKHGVNFPLPNARVIAKLKALHRSGVPVILCTGKLQAGIVDLVNKAELANPHISAGGALITDPTDKLVIKKHTLSREAVMDIVKACLAKGIYITTYGLDDYFVQRDQVCDITDVQVVIAQGEPTIVPSLLDHVAKQETVKFNAFTRNETQKQIIESILANDSRVHRIWTVHPALLPVELCVVTAVGVSKQVAALEVMEYLHVPPDQTLAVGDTPGDWGFMQLCKFVGTVGRNQELKELARSKGEAHYFLGSSVDEDGFIEVLDYFKP